MDNHDELKTSLSRVLDTNHRGTHTTPAAHLYPHQWLWDSAFIAIGLRHINLQRARTEIESIFRGQWTNGMVPHMIFDDSPKYKRDRAMWDSRLSPYSPASHSTTGITQPPMLAEAIHQVGQRMKRGERLQWYKSILPKLVKYHEWLMDERDPHDSGLTIQVHPYETGLDNTPPWIIQLHQRSKPWWIKSIERTSADRLVNLIRRDTRHVPPGQRMSNIDALMYWDIVRGFRKKSWDMDKMLHKADFMVEDVAFNSILVRANQILTSLAKESGMRLPTRLQNWIDKNAEAIEDLWSHQEGMYFCRDFVTRKHIEEPTIASLLPLYAGTISEEHAQRLVDLLKSHKHFATTYPLPSVPLSSSYYNPIHYWQGPMWLNTNWLIIKGLENYGYTKEAKHIREQSIAALDLSGPYEYFNPQSGDGLGAKDFSWTASLGLDLIHQSTLKTT